VPVAVFGELEVVAEALHPADDVADAAPGVEPAMQELQLGCARQELGEADA